MKKIWILLFFIALLWLLPTQIFAANVSIQIDYKSQKFDQMPLLSNDRVYIPIRGVSEMTGAVVSWNQAKQEVTIVKDSDVIRFRYNDTKAYVNGVEKVIPKSMMVNNRVMVPIRFVSENLGLQVDWNQKEQRVYVFTSRMVKVDAVIQAAQKYLKTPYQYGGTWETTKTFDCSSFIQKVFGEKGVVLPRTTFDQVKVGTKITKEQLQKGDLVFFDIDGKGSLSHVAIYIDENTLLQASSSKGVDYTDFGSYWSTRAKEFRRII